jgi:hypothetical protein
MGQRSSEKTVGKRAQASNALQEKKCRFTAGQVRRLEAMKVDGRFEGVDEASRVRFVLNAGFKALGVVDPQAPLIAGSIGAATDAAPVRRAA